jgi:hypothetical protein
MAEGIKKTVVEKLLDSFPTLVTVLGVALIVLGLTGGVTYNTWLPIPDMGQTQHSCHQPQSDSNGDAQYQCQIGSP